MALYSATLPSCVVATRKWTTNLKKRSKRLRQPSVDLQIKKSWPMRGNVKLKLNVLKCVNTWKSKDIQKKKSQEKLLPLERCSWKKKEFQTKMMRILLENQICQKLISWLQQRRSRIKSYEKPSEYLTTMCLVAHLILNSKQNKLKPKLCNKRNTAFYQSQMSPHPQRRRKRRKEKEADPRVNLLRESIKRNVRSLTRNTKVRILKQAFESAARSGRSRRRRHKRSRTKGDKKSSKQSKEDDAADDQTKEGDKSENESGVESAGSSPDKHKSSRKKHKKRRKHSHSPDSDKSNASRSPSPHREDKKSKRHSRSRSRTKSRSPGYRRHHSRSRSHSSRRRSRSRSLTYSPADRRQSASRSRSPRNTRERKKSFSPIRKRRDSPSFLDRRRITSARKLPIPYNRQITNSGFSSDESEMSASSRSRSRSGSRSRRGSRSDSGSVYK